MEKPNLIYINQLARGDESIKQTLIDVIKAEFPDEIKEYFKSIEEENFKEIEANVHRIKHKFSILGLEKNYEKANQFEENLREHQLNISQKDNFEKILSVISQYLKTI
ncbi:Hpt domain-containing protein [Polaribacter sp. R77954]|uniref:Hpt domain-containing protein n=1 Tax=Polaribacter sp. R77954 TaxID=3093870 RepID=UPI0037CA4F9F